VVHLVDEQSGLFVQEFAGFFDGTDLIEPGIVRVEDCRPDGGAAFALTGCRRLS
jgi:hypothetical protein